jgi:hypothetical protein
MVIVLEAMSGGDRGAVAHRAKQCLGSPASAPPRQPHQPRDQTGRCPCTGAGSGAVSAAARFERGTAPARTAAGAGTGSRSAAALIRSRYGAGTAGGRG